MSTRRDPPRPSGPRSVARTSVTTPTTTRPPVIAFLDSDDAWHPRRLEPQLGALSAETLMISSQSLVLGADEHPPGSTALIEPPIRRLDKRYHLFHNPHTTSSVLVRRDVPARFTEDRKSTRLNSS